MKVITELKEFFDFGCRIVLDGDEIRLEIQTDFEWLIPEKGQQDAFIFPATAKGYVQAFQALFEVTNDIAKNYLLNVDEYEFQARAKY